MPIQQPSGASLNPAYRPAKKPYQQVVSEVRQWRQWHQLSDAHTFTKNLPKSTDIKSQPTSTFIMYRTVKADTTLSLSLHRSDPADTSDTSFDKTIFTENPDTQNNPPGKSKKIETLCEPKSDNAILHLTPENISNLQKMHESIRDVIYLNSELWNDPSPLHHAARNGRTGIIQFLLNDGIDPNVKDYKDWTPLHVAACANHVEVAKLLYNENAGLNTTTKQGWTPLYVAAKYNRVDIAAFLLDKGADPNEKDNNNWTPLHIAVLYAHIEVVRLLHNHKADLNATTKEGLTALSLAKSLKPRNYSTVIERWLYSSATFGKRKLTRLLYSTIIKLLSSPQPEVDIATSKKPVMEGTSHPCQ